MVPPGNQQVKGPRRGPVTMRKVFREESGFIVSPACPRRMAVGYVIKLPGRSCLDAR